MTRLFHSYLQRLGVVLLAVVLLAISIFSLSPASAVSSLVPHLSDKLQHGLAYTALGFSAFIAFFSLPEDRKSLLRCNLKLMLSTLAFGTVYGLFIEFIQPFFGRTCDMRDLAADVAGLAIGIIIGFALCTVFIHFSKEEKDAQ